MIQALTLPSMSDLAQTITGLSESPASSGSSSKSSTSIFRDAGVSSTVMGLPSYLRTTFAYRREEGGDDTDGREAIEWGLSSSSPPHPASGADTG